nr:hypothetical protein [Stenotrophomonas pavanii]
MTTDNKNLADVQPGGRVRLGDGLPPLPKMQRFTNLYGETYAYTAEQMRDYARAALSAQPSPGGQGEVTDDMVKAALGPNGWSTYNEEWSSRDRMRAALAAGLTARQPVGQKPVEHDCTNCDRKHAEVICPTCAGIAWDNGRLHEFYEVRELITSLGEGALDHLLPEEWHEKPLLRFQGVYDDGDSSVGIGGQSGNVLAADQSGTVLGDYLAARAAKEGGQ